MERASERVRAFVERLKQKRHTEDAYTEIHDLRRHEPQQLAALLKLCLEQFPDGGTYFDAGLALLGEEELAELVDRSVELLKRDPEHRAAGSCVDHAALQLPEALQPYLRELFEFWKHDSCGCEPWRAAGPEDLEFLRGIVGDRSRDLVDRHFAWTCLLEAGHEEDLLAAGQGLAPNDATPAVDWLHEVGVEIVSGAIRRLVPEACFHLRFRDSFLAQFDDPEWRPKDLQPSWVLDPDDNPECKIGGVYPEECASCGQPLHRLVSLDPVPAGLGVESVERLDLTTCLSCLGWEKEALFFRHADDGSAQALPAGKRIEPEFPYHPLLETTAHLADTPKRWRRQDSGRSNSRENLNRVGGHPTWVQRAQYPTCPGCKQTMPFLLQLDSYLPLANGDKLMWGSGGIGYVFWCDACRISGGLWQCS